MNNSANTYARQLYCGYDNHQLPAATVPLGVHVNSFPFPAWHLRVAELLSIVQLYFQTMQTGRNGSLTNLYLPSSSAEKVSKQSSYTLHCHLRA